MAEKWIALHTKNFRNDTLTCTFETFSSAIDAFDRCHDLVYKEGFFGAYMVDDEGECFDRVEKM